MTATEFAGPSERGTELVAFCLTSGEELVRRIFDAWDERLAVLPLDPFMPESAVQHILRAVRPSRLVADSGETALEGRPVSAGTAAVILTSGTAGTPKAVELSHAALDWSARASVAALGSRGGRWLCCLPLHHIAGFMVVLRARLNGDLPVIHDRFDPDAIAQEKEAAFISLVPYALERLLAAGADLSSFSAILLGGGPVPEDLVIRASQKGANVVRTYGMTETCGGCVYDGLPLDGVEVKLARERILIRGPMLFTCYRMQPKLTNAALTDGWFRTADRGTFSPDGRLQVVGRLDDVIITGGKKVSARDLEQILTLHPSIKEAAVVGIPSQQWGREIAAALVLHPGRQLDLDDVRSFVASRAPGWTAPKRILQVASLPKTSTGKVELPAVALLFEEAVRD